MKIYFDGSVYYTRERFLSMVKSNADYIVDPFTTFYADNVGYAKEEIEVDGERYKVFKTGHLVDEDIIYLLSRECGGFITDPAPDELAKAFGFETGYTFHKTKEIEVKE